MSKVLDGQGHKRVIEMTEGTVDGASSIEVITYEGNMILSRVRFVIWDGNLVHVQRHIANVLDDWGIGK